MRKYIIGAGVLLLLQLALTVTLHLGGRGQLTASSSTRLFAFTPDEVQRIDLSNAAGEQIILSKDGDWRLANHHQAPADEAAVSELLAKISGLKVTGPVAVTKESVRRFKVAEDDFEKHLVLEGKDGMLADLYLGTSPAFRQMHVRKSGSDDVVAVALSGFELEPKSENWLKKDVLKQSVEELTMVELPGLTLAKTEEVWAIKDAAGLPAASPEQLTELVGKVAGLTVRGVLEPSAADELFQQEPALILKLSAGNGNTTTLRLFKHGEDYAVQSSESTLGYTIHDLLVTSITRQVDELLGKVVEDPAPEQEVEDILAPGQQPLPPFQ